MSLGKSGEDYLEAILIVGFERGFVRSIDISAFLGVTKPSVSRAMSLLRESGHVEMKPDGELVLTDSGREVAEQMYERHSTLTNFLVRLGVDRQTAAEDACRMEHVISQETFERLKQFAAEETSV